MKKEILSVLAELGVQVSSDGRIRRADLERVLADDDGGFAVNRSGRKLYDSKGNEAGEKDLQRLRDIKSKSAGQELKAVQLARQMAAAITDKDKAYRRADAAGQIFKGALGKKLVKIFEERAEEID